MTKQLQLKIATPEKLILEDIVEKVSLPTMGGEITILPDHVPLIASLSSGDIVGYEGGEEIPMAVVGGFVEVKKGEDGYTNVIILADFAEHVSHITDEIVAKAKQKAIELNKQMENKELVDFEHFETELERSLTRVRIADKWRNRKYRKI